MVLAAGLGTRMRPLTDTMPKPLVKVAGKPLHRPCARSPGRCRASRRAVVNVHHFAEQIDRPSCRRARPRIAISDERGLLLGTGGGVVKALPELGDAPFFHINSDTIWIDGVKAKSCATGRQLSIPPPWMRCCCWRPTAGSIGYAGRGDFAMAPDGRLTRRGERDVAPFVYAGAAILRPALFAWRAAGRVPADRTVRARRENRPPVRAAARRSVDACRHARSDRSGRSGHARKNQLIDCTY